MFKKYAFGVLAIIIAAASSAFSVKMVKHPSVDMYVFEYDPGSPVDYTKTRVQNTSNSIWKYQGKNLTLCADKNTKACRVAVIGTYVNSTTTPTALSGVTLTGMESSTNIAYVSAITAPLSNQFSNKP